MANRLTNRIPVYLLGLFVTCGFLIFLVYFIKHELTDSKTEITDSGMVQKISSMGKLELVKYTMKDVIEQKEIHAILPDSRVLLLAVGEVTACIDLTKIKKSDIMLSKDTVLVYLPQTEICYYKLDHQKSKIYDISGAWFEVDAKDMVESIYKLADQRILDNAKQMDVLGLARTNAQLIFKPLLESISRKKVVLRFR